MLAQTEWYQDASGAWYQLSQMGEDSKGIAAERLTTFALTFAHTVFKDLYAYGYPSGEQAQWDLERAEGEAEAIMASKESAREWIAQSPLYEALTGHKASVEPEEWEEGYEELAASHTPVRPRFEDMEAGRKMEISLLDQEILRLGQVEHQTQQVLKYLRELRERLS